MKQLAFLFLVALTFSSCVTPRKTYKPPSNVQVEASTKKVQEGIGKARDLAREVKTHVQDIQKGNDKISVLGMSVQEKIDALIKIAPADMQPALSGIKSDVSAMQIENEKQGGLLTLTLSKQEQLEKQNLANENSVGELRANQALYYTNAQGLANDATNEREARRIAEGQLVKQRIFGWLWKIGGGAIVVLVIVLIVLWFTGKLAVKFAK